MTTTTTERKAGRYAFEGLERSLHERARLGIMVALAAAPAGCRFGELRDGCGLTDGNLSRHLEVLRDADLIEIWKGYEGRRPQTWCRLTSAGRRRFRAYLRLLQRIADRALAASGRTAPPVPPAGFSRA
jgi:DNA-binding transcriptional ArsR family regulator